MTFQAYLDAVKARTGLTPEDFARLAADRGFSKSGQYVAWLKADHGLGHGHAMAIAAAILKGDQMRAPAADRLDALFTGAKAPWRETADRLVEAAKGFGADVTASPNTTYINLNRGRGKFAIVQPSSGRRLDVGLKLKGIEAAGRLGSAAGWNEMLTHRVSLAAPAEADAELIGWMKAAYDEAVKA